MAAEAAPKSAPPAPSVDAETSDVSFAELGLDDRLLQAVASLGWAAPTLIQEHAIREALSGRDILARARTGSGKTGAYALPLLQTILAGKDSVDAASAVRGLVLVPTKELTQQAVSNLQDLARHCSRSVSVLPLTASDKTDKAQRAALKAKPDIVVGTPTAILHHLTAKSLRVKDSLRTLVIDEADLVFSFGYEEHLRELLSHIPSIRQTMLMSATLNTDVDALKSLVLRSPAVLKLEESDLPGKKQLSQYTVQCEEDDKYLIVYALLKLRLVRGKTLIFVGSVNGCYKLKLFLEQFSIRACVLNSELPVNSRQHVVQQFNKVCLRPRIALALPRPLARLQLLFALLCDWPDEP